VVSGTVSPVRACWRHRSGEAGTSVLAAVSRPPAPHSERRHHDLPGVQQRNKALVGIHSGHVADRVQDAHAVWLVAAAPASMSAWSAWKAGERDRSAADPARRSARRLPAAHSLPGVPKPGRRGLMRSCSCGHLTATPPSEQSLPGTPTEHPTARRPHDVGIRAKLTRLAPIGSQTAPSPVSASTPTGCSRRVTGVLPSTVPDACCAPGRQALAERAEPSPDRPTGTWHTAAASASTPAPAGTHTRPGRPTQLITHPGTSDGQPAFQAGHQPG